MLFCGIDVAKRKHVALIMDDTGKQLGTAFSFENNRSGFDQMLAELRALPGPVSIGLEATGHYWLALYDELTRQGYAVTVLTLSRWQPIVGVAYASSRPTRLMLGGSLT